MLALCGCGGTKTDFGVKPKSYTFVVASPAAADDVELKGISRDGRVVGNYNKAGTVTVFGWSADGTTVDLTLPTECKSVEGIDELGTVACSDKSVVPARLFIWSGSDTTRLSLPKSASFQNIKSMTFEAGVPANLGGAGAYQLKDGQDPIKITDFPGVAEGTSLSGNICGTDQVGSVHHAYEFVNGKKINIGLFAGRETTGISINDHGDVVGTASGTAKPTNAYKWSKGKFSNLPSPPLALRTDAYDINNEGIVSGSALVGSDVEAVLWFPKTGAVYVKDLVQLPSSIHLNRAWLTTPLGIVLCEARIKTGATFRNAVVALMPTYP